MLTNLGIRTVRGSLHRLTSYIGVRCIVAQLVATEVSSVASGIMSTVIVAAMPAVIGAAIEAAMVVAVRVANMMKVIAATAVGDVGHVAKENLRSKELSP